MRKRDYTKKQIALIVIGSFAAIVLAVVLNRIHPVGNKDKQNSATPGALSESALSQEKSSQKEEKEDSKAEQTPHPEEHIATFLQGPKSWKQRLDWSGEWGDAYYDGGKFGGFGCGLCCMANLYTSLTPYQCSPLDMYRYAKKTSGYGGGGAIDWGYIKETLRFAGFTSDVGKKPPSYEEFQKKTKENLALLVVVSSQNSTCYWQDTPGHYVTLFLYDEEKDSIFLADSGNPNHNRHWVALKKIYRSLKTANRWQFLEISAYNEKADKWKHRTFGGNCVLPDAWK